MRRQIGIFVQRFPVRSETFIVTKLLGLLERGFDVHLFTLTESADWDSFEVLRGREDVRARLHIAPPFNGARLLTQAVPRLVAVGLRHPAAFARFVAHCWRERRTHPLGFLRAVMLRAHVVGHDLALMHIEFDMQAAIYVDLKRFFGCKLLISGRGSLKRAGVYDRDPDLPAYLYRHADAWHFISKYLYDEAVSLGLDPSVPWRLIVPAIDLSLFSARPTPHANAPGAPLRLLSVGRLAWDRGYEFALEAVARAAAAGVVLEYTIIGAGDYQQAVACAVEQLGLHEAVTLRGPVRREEVIAHLHRADIFVHFALTEGFANAVIEAQAAGLPVITSDAGGLPENVAHGVTGFVVPRRDSEAMAEAILTLARDPALRGRMAEAGRARALALFDLRAQIDAFDAFYTALLEDAL